MKKLFHYLWLLIAGALPLQEKGFASYYADSLAGKPMANGQPYNPNALTAASWFYPIGSLLRVTNTETGRRVYVTVSDRGPSKALVKCGRIIDLSKAAFQAIDSLPFGLASVQVERVL